MKLSQRAFLLIVPWILGASASLCFGESADKGAWIEIPTGSKQITISSENVSLRVDLPSPESGYYQGQRFDGAAMVSEATWNGHRFFTRFKADDPLTRHEGAGTAEEFDLKSPPGYLPVAPGGHFLKIGVGILQKTSEEPYRFFKTYPLIQRFGWRIWSKDDALRFTQAGTLESISYEYEKSIQIDENGFTVRRCLRNVGKIRFETTHYSHHFIRIDDKPPGPSYQVTLPFELPRALEREFPLLKILAPSTFGFLAPITDQQVFFRHPVAGNQSAPVSLQVRTEKVALEIVSCEAIQSVTFYADRDAICPEPFTHIGLDPGEEMKWRTTYIFRRFPGKTTSE